MAKKPEDISPIHHFNIDAQASHIYLMGEDSYVSHESGMEPGVEYIMANRFIKNMNICLRTNPSKPILIHMKTCGGLWEEGMAIHNTIRACPVPVTILNYTHARSMSSLIFLSASKRVMMPDSYFMFHEGTLAQDGTYKQFMTIAAWEKKGRTRMIDIYVNALKEQGKFKHLSEEKIRSMLTRMMDKKEDVFLTAQEAVEWGFADEIFGDTDDFDWAKLTEYTDEQLAR
jgi:ATP-dependent protease ClpP protease subunit